MSELSKIAQFEENVVQIDGWTMNYEEAGSGGDIVVVLHGTEGLARNRTWELLAEAGKRVVLMGLPGFSLSDQEPHLTPGEYVSIVDAAISTVVDGSYHLVGSSFGSEVAARVALLPGSPVESLVLLAPTLVRSKGTLEHMMSGDKNVWSTRTKHFDLPSVPDVAVEQRRSLFTRLFGEVNTELHGELSQLTVPVLSIMGTQDEFLDSALLREYARMIPGSYLSFVYDAGHFVEVERPEALANAVNNFVTHGHDFRVTRTSSLLFP